MEEEVGVTPEHWIKDQTVWCLLNKYENNKGFVHTLSEMEVIQASAATTDIR